MKTYKIHLIRHGATDANVLGQYIGQRTDTPLSPEGLNELRLLKDNHIVKARKFGKNVEYSIADAHVKEIIECGMSHINEIK